MVAEVTEGEDQLGVWLLEGPSKELVWSRVGSEAVVTGRENAHSAVSLLVNNLGRNFHLKSMIYHSFKPLKLPFFSRGLVLSSLHQLKFWENPRYQLETGRGNPEWSFCVPITKIISRLAVQVATGRAGSLSFCPVELEDTILLYNLLLRGKPCQVLPPQRPALLALDVGLLSALAGFNLVKERLLKMLLAFSSWAYWAQHCNTVGIPPPHVVMSFGILPIVKNELPSVLCSFNSLVYCLACLPFTDFFKKMFLKKKGGLFVKNLH